MNRYVYSTAILFIIAGNIYGNTLLSESMNSSVVLDINENLINYDFFRSTLSTQHTLLQTQTHAGYLSYSDQLNVAFLSNQLIDTIIEFSLLLHIGEAIGIKLGQSELDDAKKRYLKQLSTTKLNDKHPAGLLNYANLIGKKRYVKQAILNHLETQLSPKYINQVIRENPGISLTQKHIAYESIKLESGPIIYKIRDQKKWKKIKKLTHDLTPIALSQTDPQPFEQCPHAIQTLLLKMTHIKRPIVYDDGQHIWALSIINIRDNTQINAKTALHRAVAQHYLTNWLAEAGTHTDITINKDYIMGIRPHDSIIQDWVPRIEYFIDYPITQGISRA